MKDYLQTQITAVLQEMGVSENIAVQFQPPARPEFGDLATNIALQLARPLKNAPRRIAEDLAERLRARPLDPNRIARLDVAGPGFINFYFAETYIQQGLEDILAAGETYGRQTKYAGKRALVEFVSANPTGPLTVGHGRNAVLGDTMARLLAWVGYEVTREYYFNNAGRQMRVLGASVQARVRELLHPEGEKRIQDGFEVPVDFPEGGYLGDYITDIARDLLAEKGSDLGEVDDLTLFTEAAEKANFADIDRTMRRLGIHMDDYFNEHTLYTSGAVWDIVDALKARDLAYEADGAVWFKTTAFGKEKDTVLVKSTGEPTYRLPDIAYHINKVERGFDKIVDIFGADHQDTYPDVLQAVESLGYSLAAIDVVIYQFVTLLQQGKPVKMSTRKATFVTLDQLMDEVSEDVTRFFFLMRAPQTHLEFDLDLAKEASEKNPVFYLQYAHARICNILHKAEEVGLSCKDAADFGLLQHTAEHALIKTLLRLPEIIQKAAEQYEPHQLIGYLRDVAVAFSQFYHECHVIGAETEALGRARLHLVEAARHVLKNGLTVLGLSAPEQM